MSPSSKKSETGSSFELIWEGLIFPVVILIVGALSFMAATSLSSAVDRFAHWPEWQTELLMWAVSVVLGLAAGFPLGMLVRRSEWKNRLVTAGFVWALVFTALTLAIAVVLPFLPTPPTATPVRPSAGVMLGIWLYLSGWGVAVPLAVVAGLWLGARRPIDMVEMEPPSDAPQGAQTSDPEPL